MGEMSIKVSISENHLARNFTLILGYITAGRTITLQEIKLENEQYKAHLAQIKLQKKEQIDKKIKAILAIINKIVKHKSFKWWFSSLIGVVILVCVVNSYTAKEDIPNIQQTYIPNPYDTYKTSASEGSSATVNNAQIKEPTKAIANNCKTQSQIRKELTKATGEVLYNICYNNFDVIIDKSKAQKAIPVKQTSIDALTQIYKVCKGANLDDSLDASVCCASALEAHKEVSEQNIKASISNDEIKTVCATLI